ncbi:MAG: hypothetical protein H6751_04995 [Candidatus Omnitrophica bacterium]|nr:hypothetical protein [Candidatus Omnitrophota bacterium]
MTNELHPDLQSWLDTATADLAEQSKVRVVEDVVRHYEEVFEEAFGSGLNPELSNEVGLTALGDPAKAAKKYGKTYLIRSEAEFLRENSSADQGD